MRPKRCRKRKEALVKQVKVPRRKKNRRRGGNRLREDHWRREGERERKRPANCLPLYFCFYEV
jgi:hypothetical protein